MPLPRMEEQSSEAVQYRGQTRPLLYTEVWSRDPSPPDSNASRIKAHAVARSRAGGILETLGEWWRSATP